MDRRSLLLGSTAVGIVCAKTRNGFCQNVGGALGCKVGRGTSEPEQCVASIDQHILSGNEAIASAILELGRNR